MIPFFFNHIKSLRNNNNNPDAVKKCTKFYKENEKIFFKLNKQDKK